MIIRKIFFGEVVQSYDTEKGFLQQCFLTEYGPLYEDINGNILDEKDLKGEKFEDLLKDEQLTLPLFMRQPNDSRKISKSS